MKLQIFYQSILSIALNKIPLISSINISIDFYYLQDSQTSHLHIDLHTPNSYIYIETKKALKS